MNAEEIYREAIMDYYRKPRNNGSLENPQISSRDVNPLCGDEVTIQIGLDKDRIKEIRFNGKGCIISQVSASMLTELAEGKTLSEASKLDKAEIIERLGVPISAARLKCALLSLKVLKTGIYGWI